MSTTKSPLKYLWQAVFEDGNTIEQPADDRYSKHDDTAEQNPSAFRDVQEYEDKSPLVAFILNLAEDPDGKSGYGVNLAQGVFVAHTGLFSLEEEPLTDRKLIFFRQMNKEMDIYGTDNDPYVANYILGYEGKNDQGKVVKKLIYVSSR